MATEKLSPGALLTEAKPKRAAIYARVSTGDQHLETQLLDLREMAKQHGDEIAHQYREVISGAKSKRPGLHQLLADARRHRFDMVLVAAFDRVARSVRHFLEVLDELAHLGIEFISLRENIDTGGPLGRAIVVIVGAIAELEKRLIVERVKAGMRRAKLEGRRIGRTPLSIDRAQVVAERRAGMSLTAVARKYRISRATVCGLVNEAGALELHAVIKKAQLASQSQATCRLPRDCQSESLKRWIRYLDHLLKVIGKHKPIAIACGLLVWTFRCLGKNLTDTVVTRQTHTLVVHGPYRWVRHPCARCLHQRAKSEIRVKISQSAKERLERGS